MKKEDEYSKFQGDIVLEANSNQPSVSKNECLESVLFDNSNIYILFVDDDETNQLFVGIQLKKLRYKMDSAFNGREAIDQVEDMAKQGKKYDIIFMDVSMPVMGGIEATFELREKNYLMPIIILTGHEFNKEMDVYVRQLATSIITKPCSLQRMEAMIKKHLDK